MSDEQDLPIPSSELPSKSIELAVEYLVKVVEHDIKVNNGTTALYWHLIAVIQQHTSRFVEIKHSDPDRCN